ncbi:hypothetical protein OLX23_21680 [Novosphingobium sp. JCM 18896]|nr:hypothetical protein [Novosphingobium sp. JCM 18896]
MFDVQSFFDADQSSMPANGIVTARYVSGRTISTSIRFYFSTSPRARHRSQDR